MKSAPGWIHLNKDQISSGQKDINKETSLHCLFFSDTKKLFINFSLDWGKVEMAPENTF